MDKKLSNEVQEAIKKAKAEKETMVLKETLKGNNKKVIIINGQTNT